ncbi:MAG: ECF-type sigma factor [Gemmataceae bacterium]
MAVTRIMGLSDSVIETPTYCRRGSEPDSHLFLRSSRTIRKTMSVGRSRWNSPKSSFRGGSRGLRAGNAAAMLDFWNRMGPALERLAQKRMEPGLQRRVGPEDVAQSVCRTFFRRMQQGEFSSARADFGLLCAITLAKVREKARHHLRQKRGLQRERALEGPEPGAEFVHASDEPTPAEHAEFADLLQHVLGDLDEEERQIVELRPAGSNASGNRGSDRMRLNGRFGAS